MKAVIEVRTQPWRHLDRGGPSEPWPCEPAAWSKLVIYVRILSRVMLTFLSTLLIGFRSSCLLVQLKAAGKGIRFRDESFSGSWPDEHKPAHGLVSEASSVN